MRALLRAAPLAVLALALFNCEAQQSDRSAKNPKWADPSIGNDPKALQFLYGSDAKSACKDGADAFLSANHSMFDRWNGDDAGFVDLAFDKYSKRSFGPAILVMVSDQTRISNGLGDFNDSNSLYCVYSVGADKVLQYSFTDPDVSAYSGEE